MRVDNQISLIYLAKRMYPSLSLNDLREKEIKLLGPDTSIKLTPRTDIDDMTLNNALKEALSLGSADSYFRNIPKFSNACNFSEIILKASSFREFHDLISEEVRDEITRRLGELDYRENEHVRVDEDGSPVFEEDGHPRLIDLIDCLTQYPFEHEKPFSFARFYKFAGFNTFDCRDYTIAEVIDLLSLALDLGIVEICDEESSSGVVKFKMGLSQEAYKKMQEVFAQFEDELEHIDE